MTDEAPTDTPDRHAAPICYPANAVHLLRTSQMAQISLSQMADTKASILMGATFVIFTITIGQARQGAAFFAAIFAVLAVLPKTVNHKPTAKSNLLFFGVFSQMNEDEFVEEVMSRLHNEDSFYRTMARDIHQAGSVLQNKKYRFLGYAYRIFLAGLVASCASYVILYLI
jgi:hypothetical protein